MFRKLLKRVLIYTYLFRKTKWKKIFQNHSKQSSNIVLLAPSYPKRLSHYFRSGSLENDFALLDAVLERNEQFRIILGFKNVEHIRDSKIYHNLSSLYTENENEDYTEALLNFQKSLLSRSNVLIPSHKDSLYWENKVFMHERFTELGISHPKTIVVEKGNPLKLLDDLVFPVLFKPAHSSGAQGITKLDSLDTLKSHLRQTDYDEYMIQEWIDMRRDLRLIFIGNELVVHYWRINQSEEWKPTSTGHGSSVDFVSLPTEWMPFIKDQYQKLGLKTGAFDITWRDDDLANTPLILEVSPSYMPNPSPRGAFEDQPYSEYKKSLFGKDAYHKNYIDLVFELKKKLISVYH